MAKKLNIRIKRFQKEFHRDNVDLVKAINKIENFLSKYYLITSDSFMHYRNGKRNKNKVILAIIMRIAMALSIIKYFLSFITKNRMIMALINDETNLVGNPRLVSLMLSLFIGEILLGGIYLQYTDMSNTCFPFDFLQMLKVYSRSNKFNMRNQRKFGRRIYLVVNILFKGFYVLAIVSSLTILLALCLAYYKSKQEYYLPCLLFWSLVTIISQIQFQSIIISFCALAIIIGLYLRNKFQELNDSIVYFTKQNDIESMLRVIIEHDAVAVLAHKLNKSCRFYIFIIVFMEVPALQLMSYMTYQESTTSSARLTSWSFFVSYIVLLVPLSMIATNITRWAHRPINRVYSFMAKNKVDLKSQMKLQIFIERLSGPPIGFYCLNFFPVTNYEFYQYILTVASNHLLFMETF